MTSVRIALSHPKTTPLLIIHCPCRVTEKPLLLLFKPLRAENFSSSPPPPHQLTFIALKPQPLSLDLINYYTQPTRLLSSITIIMSDTGRKGLTDREWPPALSFSLDTFTDFPQRLKRSSLPSPRNPPPTRPRRALPTLVITSQAWLSQVCCLPFFTRGDQSLTHRR